MVGVDKVMMVGVEVVVVVVVGPSTKPPAGD